jgi:hypothetical protein
VQKFDKKDIEVHDTEERGTGKLPPVRSDPIPPQRTKKETTPTPSEEHDGEGGIIFKGGVETFKFDTD